MKPGRTIFSLLVALIAAITFLTHTGFAQELVFEKRASGECVAGDASKLAVMKESAINSQPAAPPVRKTFNTSAATIISFLPADFFASMKESKVVEPGYRTNGRDITTSAGVTRRSDYDDPAALAKKLLNPVSSLTRISFRNSVDYSLAVDREGWRYTMNFEPVTPIPLNKDWNLISRTDIPFIQQDGIVASTVQTGLGDIHQSVFISPTKTKTFSWGAGAAALIPTGTDTSLSAGKFGLGPTLAVTSQHRRWTYGALARHIWSVAGHRDRADVRSTFIQPFVGYTTKSAWTYSLYAESAYDWEGRQWSAPVHLEVTKVVRFGLQHVSVGGALRCWAATFPGGPQACGFRFVITPLFPAR